MDIDDLIRKAINEDSLGDLFKLAGKIRERFFPFLRLCRFKGIPGYRFRPADRKNHLGRALAPLAPEGRIIVSTQVVEAGIDISAATLFTDIAPWPSLAQRFGRCNRHGERASADIYWIDRELTAACARRPYSEAELATARHRLLELEDASPGTLPKTEGDMEVRQDLRKQDMLNLFDTTPDLAGEDVARLSLHPLLGRPERLCVLAGLRPAEWQPVRPASTVS